MLAQTFGRLREEGEGRRGIRFERVYDYKPEELWAALTDPEQLRAWLAPTDIDLRVGGGIEVRFGDDPSDEKQMVHGVIRELEPLRVLEYEWRFPGEDDSVVRFELEPRGEGTLLVLDHRLLGSETVPGYGAGWHAHLDALELMLAGRSQNWDERFQELRPAYAEQARALSGDL